MSVLYSYFLPYNCGKLLAVQTSSLIKSNRQSSKTSPMLRVAGVSTSEDVAPGFLIKKSQHSLLLYLHRSETVTPSKHIKFKIEKEFFLIKSKFVFHLASFDLI